MTTMTEETARPAPREKEVWELTPDEQVDNGEAWLDEHHPGWYDRVNLETLDIYDSNLCVAGQGGGRRLYMQLMQNDDKLLVTRLGFSKGNYGSYRDLEDAWKRRILNRRAA